jgi:glycosyltransferase involved in cell wall biosynthesis
MRALVLLVAHNEAVNLPAVIAELRRVEPTLDILVVDDASEDETPALLGTLGVRHMRLGQRLGVGGAVRAGLRCAYARGYERVVRLDADGQHQPRDIAALLAALDGVDAVVGSRYVGPTGYRTPVGRRLAQRALASGLSLLAGRRVTDPTSGFWGFGPCALALLCEHHPTGYPEPELHLLLTRNRLAVREVFVEMRDRLRGRTSLTPARVALALARAALAMVVVPLRARDVAGAAGKAAR